MEAVPVRLGAHEILYARHCINAYEFGRGDSSPRALADFFCDLYESVTAINDRAREKFSLPELRLIESAPSEWAFTSRHQEDREDRHGGEWLTVALASFGFDLHGAAMLLGAALSDVKAEWPTDPGALVEARAMLRDGADHRTVMAATGVSRRVVDQMSARCGRHKRPYARLTAAQAATVDRLTDDGHVAVEVHRRLLEAHPDVATSVSAVSKRVGARRALAVA